jgi:hypothetical protein
VFTHTRQQELRQTYSTWFKTPDGRAFTQKFGRSIPIYGDSWRPHDDNGGETEFCDPAMLPRASMVDHSIDHLEPAETSAPLDGISDEDLKSAVTTFEAVMRWCLEGHGLVDKGRRSWIAIGALRPDLAVQVASDQKEAQIFARAFAGSNGALKLTGRLYGPVLEFLRRGARLSELGQQLVILFYVFRPDLLDEPATLAELGNSSKKTRQALCKRVNELRDMFGGLKARTMRADITRARCKEAQLRGKRSSFQFE